MTPTPEYNPAPHGRRDGPPFRYLGDPIANHDRSTRHAWPGGRGAIDAAELEHHLRTVLDGLGFPARRWQLLATADYFGADAITMGALHGLRGVLYRTLGEVVADIVTADAARARMKPR